MAIRDLSEILASGIDAARDADPQGFMRPARMDTAADVVADGTLSPDEAAQAYGLDLTAEERARLDALVPSGRPPSA